VRVRVLQIISEAEQGDDGKKLRAPGGVQVTETPWLRDKAIGLALFLAGLGLLIVWAGLLFWALSKLL
jgi:hypothetical protein